MKTSLYKHLFLFVLCSILFAMIPLTAFAEADYTVTDMSAVGSISTSTLNVRIGPSKDYESIGQVSSSDTITITGQASTGWYRIDYNGEEGYISNSYVTIAETDSVETGSIDEANTFADYIEESESKTLSPITYIIIGIIVIIILAIIISMIKMFRNSDDEDEFEDEDEDIYEDDEAEEEDIEEDDTAYIPPAPRKNKPIRKPPSKTPASEPKASNTARKAAPSKTPGTKAPMQESTTIIKGDDYRIYIDPRYFEEEEKSVSEPIPDKTDLEIEEAMNKLNELQQEIERLKRQKKSE